MQKIDLLCTALQWFGFIAIAVGTYYVGPNPFRAAAWFVPGAAALTGWCLLQEPVPFGILGVQLVCGGFSTLNVYRLWPTYRHPIIRGYRGATIKDEVFEISPVASRAFYEGGELPPGLFSFLQECRGAGKCPPGEHVGPFSTWGCTPGYRWTKCDNCGEKLGSSGKPGGSSPGVTI